MDRDYEFHHYLLHVAGLDEIVPIWRSIFSRLRDFHEQANHELGDFRTIGFVHEALVSVFRSGDLERSVVALAEHLLDGDFNIEQKARWRAMNGTVSESL